MSDWLSILPSLAAIVLAMWTRQIIPSLLIGLWVGGFLVSPGFLPSILSTIDYIAATISDRGNLDVLLFLYVFSGLVAMIQVSGGVQGFSHWVERYVKSRRSALLASWLLLPITFIDCGFRVVAAGSIMKPLARDHDISRERLAYMLNNSASPVIGLIPVATTFVGYMLSLLASSAQLAGVSQAAFPLFLQTIPLNFFSYTSVAIAISSIFFVRRFGPNEAGSGQSPTHPERGGQFTPALSTEFSEELAPQSGKQMKSEEGSEELSGKARERMDTAKDQMGVAIREKMQGMDTEDHMQMGEKPVLTPRAWNLGIPIAFLIGLSFVLVWWGGRAPGRSLTEAFAEADAARMMLIALFLTALLAGILYRFQGITLKTLVDRFISGGNKLMVTLIILALAWPIATVSKDLGLPSVIENTLGATLPTYLVAVTVFAVTAAVTYFVGSSWGAWALMMPLAIPLAASSGASIPLAAAAVFSGGTFGDVTSPLSGMTAMAAGISKADHMAYVRAATPYNLSAAGVAAALFLIAPFFL